MDTEHTQKIIYFETRSKAFPANFLRRFHLHLLCHRGHLKFVFNDKPFTCQAQEFVFLFAESKVTKMSFSANFKATVLLVEKNFLNENLPDLSLSIDAQLHSKENPVLHFDKNDKEKVISNFRQLYARFKERGHRFYEEVLKRQMQLFILEMWHVFANEFEHRKRTLLGGSLYERFIHLTQEHCMKEREVDFYARRLNITPKYLNYVCKQSTGVTASEWIQRFARERIILLLQNKNLNVAEIAENMNFSSRSYFTRYVKKLLGATPTEYRNRLL
jgi:AraC family transcriptional activator of pobA